MNDDITVFINEKEYKFAKDTSLLEMSRLFVENFEHSIVLASVDGVMKELFFIPENNAKIVFFDLTSTVANRSYVAGLMYLMQYSIKELYGSSVDVIVHHSIDKGILIEPTIDLDEERIKVLEEKMNEVVKQDLPIKRLTVDRLEASNYFKKIGDMSKVGVLKYNTNSVVTLYRLGNLYNYFYTYMPVSTGVLNEFELTYVSKRRLVLRFPSIYTNGKIKEYVEHKNMLEAFNACNEFNVRTHMQNASDINNIVSQGKINELIRLNEMVYNEMLLGIARKITSKKEVELVLIAGPSSSGKTTVSKKLKLCINGQARRVYALAMDDFFKNREENPKVDGKYDFESLDSVDLDLFNTTIQKLLNKEETPIPKFNFISGKKEFEEKWQLVEGDILIIEGIHALDNHILGNIERKKKYKIYISPITEVNMDNQSRISTTDNRLLRRIIRDNRTRGYNVEQSLAFWPDVRKGEEEYIFPYQDDADYTFNSGLIYEIGVLKTYVEPLLYNVDITSPYYEEAKRLINFLRIFLPIPSDAVPEDSVLREFIGGSCYHD